MEKANNYILGRGKYYFNQFAPGTQVGTGERYFGNAPAGTINVQANTLDHYNSDSPIKEIDDSVTLQVDRKGTITTDNVSPENLALWFFGSASALTQTPGTALTDTFPKVTAGMFYQLGASITNPTGVRNVANVVVKDDATPSPTTFVLGTDYNVDLALGRVEVLEGGAIVSGTTNLVVTYDTTASTRQRIISGTNPIEGSLRFISASPVGIKTDYFFPWVKITPNGDFALKGETFQEIPFNIEILKMDGYEAIYAEQQV